MASRSSGKSMKEPAAPFSEQPLDRKASLMSQVAHLQHRAGPFSEPFDMKAFLDEEWDAPKGDFSKTDLASVENIAGDRKSLETPEG
ncbi:hypothetical protein [Agrobacterium sp. NPDC090283]|uniref:hypothetical protein n=1 Tax=Agrobacterium sp. NPDC090283 TaxID=3363920 RepID=UPI00383B3D7E